jgi:hypothetical protein
MRVMNPTSSAGSHGARLALVVGILLATASAPAATNSPAGYLRVDESTPNIIRLQTAARRMVPANGNGPVIWLGAVTHIGSSNYFRGYEELLRTNDQVFFEAVLPEKEGGWSGPEFHRLRGLSAPGEESESNLQTDLARALGLAFQLESVHYGRTNFINSDLSMEAVQELMLEGMNIQPAEDQPEPTPEAVPADDGFSQLMAIMQGRGFIGGLIKFGVQMIAANPRMQATTKLTFIEVLGRLKGDLAKAQALPPELSNLLNVLIHKRNQKVTRDLRKALKQARPPASIAVFYGAGHMADLETRVRRRLKYLPAEDVWLTAFEVDLASHGIPRWEREMIRFMTESQMKMLIPAENE